MIGPLEQDHCVNRLIDDYLKAGGICPGGLIDIYNLQYETAPIELCFKPNGFPTGICSVETEESLKNDDLCLYETIDKSPPMLANTIFILNHTSCFHFDRKRKRSSHFGHFDPIKNKHNLKSKPRLNPLYEVGEKPSNANGEIYRTTLEFEHTKHRYPWICSLRCVIKIKS